MRMLINPLMFEHIYNCFEKDCLTNDKNFEPYLKKYTWLRVSMGLNVSRKTAKNLAVRRKNGRILTVSRRKMLTVKKI